MYVGLDGNDSYTREQAQNYSTPWKTIHHAVNQLEPGDMLVAKDGIYTEAVDATIFAMIWEGGTADNWVIIKAENQLEARLTGQNNSTQNGFCLEDSANYIWFEGFEIDSFSRCGILNNQSNHDVCFFNNYIHDIARVLRDDPKGGASGIKTNYYSWNITIDRCLIHTIGRLPDPDEEGPWSDNYKHDHGIYCQGFNIKIQNNIIYDCPAGWSIKIDGTELDLEGSTHIITNNTFALHTNPQRSGYLRFAPHAEMFKPKNVIIQNNIFHEPAQGVAITKDQNVYTGIIRNNLMTCDTIIWDEYSEIDPDSIEIYGNMINTYPDFVDINNFNFHIQGSSPCIDSGFVQFAPLYDFDMNERPIGAGFDIGAYEYSATYIEEENILNKLEASAINYRNLLIFYSVSRKEHINISVYDQLGGKVSVLIDEIKEPGNYSESKEINHIPSGTYFVAMKAQNALLSKKYIILR